MQVAQARTTEQVWAKLYDDYLILDASQVHTFRNAETTLTGCEETPDAR